VSWKTAHRSFYYDGAPEPDDPAIDPAATAFLVIDVQNVYLERPDPETLSIDGRRRYHAWTPFHDRMRGTVIPRTAAMLELCRRHGIECIFARIACHKLDGRDRSLSQKLPGWNNLLLPAGEHPAQIVPELAPVGDEIVITKTTDSALTGTNLRLVLRNMEVSTVVCAGIFTDQCVSSTVRSLADESFRVLVLEDCCAAGADELHRRELEIINMIYCHVMGSRDFADLVEKQRGGKP
jgi:nicotinamidase-related amidase